jgi:hypothetical protein
MTITARVRGAMHTKSIELLQKLQFPMALIKRTIKNVYQIAIKYLAYVVLNKRKLDNK